MTNNDIWKDIRVEIQETQKRRAAYVRQKFTYVIGLLGIGSISIGSFQPISFLYLAPLIAFAFDLYILGEDFGVKRASGFLSRQDVQSPDDNKKWERYCKENRDPFSRLGGPFLTFLVLIASILVLWTQAKNTSIYWIWIITNIIVLIGMVLYSNYLNKKIQKI